MRSLLSALDGFFRFSNSDAQSLRRLGMFYATSENVTEGES